MYETSWADVSFLAKRAAQKAIPIVSLASLLIETSYYFDPSHLLDESEEVKPESYVLDNSGQIDSLSEHYVEQYVSLNESLKGQETFKSTVKRSARKSWNTYFDLTKTLSKKMQMDVNLALRWPDNQNSPQYLPYQAVGGQYSSSNPCVVVTPPFIRIEDQKTYDAMQKLFEEKLNEESSATKEFVLAHEFSHIQNNDTFKFLCMSTFAVIASSIPWLYPMVTTSSWITYFMQAYSGSFVVQLVSEFTQSFFSKDIEMRADKDAMTTLKTNEGALNFTKVIHDQGLNDPFHPPAQKRYNQALAFNA